MLQDLIENQDLSATAEMNAKIATDLVSVIHDCSRQIEEVDVEETPSGSLRMHLFKLQESTDITKLTDALTNLS